MSFPKKLNLEHYYSSPVWWADETKFVKKLKLYDLDSKEQRQLANQEKENLGQ